MPCIAWLTPMTSKAALNNALTSCYSSSLVCNNYPRLYYQISSKLEISAVPLAEIKYCRSYRHKLPVYKNPRISEELVKVLVPYFRLKAREKVKFCSSWHAAYKHINKLSQPARMWMSIVTKNTFTFVTIYYVWLKAVPIMPACIQPKLTVLLIIIYVKYSTSLHVHTSSFDIYYGNKYMQIHIIIMIVKIKIKEIWSKKNN